MEVIVANEENWKNRELNTKDCQKFKISCNKITAQFVVESEKDQKKPTKKKS